MKKFFFSALICSFFTLSVFSQTSCNPEFDPFCEDIDNQIPIDEGVALVLGLATLYGVKTLRTTYKKEVL